MMKAELIEIDGVTGTVIQRSEIQLSKPDVIEESNERIIMISQDDEVRLSIKFELEDGKIVNPKLMHVVSSENGLTLTKD